MFYEKGMKQREGAAYHRMAYMYYNGKGVTQDDKKCLKALEQAANEYYVPAIYNLPFL